MAFEQLTSRIVTAGVLSGALLLLLIFADSFCPVRAAAPLVLSSVVFLAASELSALLSKDKGQRLLALVTMSAPALMLSALVLQRGCGSTYSALQLLGLIGAVSALSLFVLLLGLLYRFRNDLTGASETLGEWLIGFIHVGVGGAAWVSMFAVNGSVWWLFWVVLVVALSDTGAYFGGSYIGGPKLAPAISPKKTLSGSLAGIIAAVLAGVISGIALSGPLLVPSWSVLQLTALSVVVSLGGQVGDLIKSLLKRNHQVKDTGNLLPGHGGVLDRIDGMLAGSLVLLAALSLGGL